MIYLWVALGSAIGGAGRYWLATLVGSQASGMFPWGTLAVNVLGSFIIGLVAVITEPIGRLSMPIEARQFIMIGICGGFTTFSTFSFETMVLLRAGDWGWAVTNIVLSVFLCLSGVVLGTVVAQAVNRAASW